MEIQPEFRALNRAECGFFLALFVTLLNYLAGWISDNLIRTLESGVAPCCGWRLLPVAGVPSETGNAIRILETWNVAEPANGRCRLSFDG